VTPVTTARNAIDSLRALASKKIDQTARKHSVDTAQVLGVSTKDVRALAQSLAQSTDKVDELADALWTEPFHEAKMLAILLFARKPVSPKRCERWVHDIKSWGVCDQFAKTMAAPAEGALSFIIDWCAQEPLYVRRAGFATMANLCMKSHELEANVLDSFTSLIQTHARDERQHVRQAVCWALRELGKIDHTTHEHAAQIALELIDSQDVAQSWVGRCAYKELEQLVSVPERRRLISASSKTARKHAK